MCDILSGRPLNLPVHCLCGVPLLGHELQVGLGQLRVPVGDVEVKFDYRDAQDEVLQHEHGQVRDVQGAGQAPALCHRPEDQRNRLKKKKLLHFLFDTD